MSFLTSANIAADIGGQTSSAWLALGNSLALAAVAPFAGALSDLIGRRYFALTGTIVTIVGLIIVGTAHRMPVAIGGMALAGLGGGIALTVGLSGVAELAPVKQRGRYIGTVYFAFITVAASPAYGSSFLVNY